MAFKTRTKNVNKCDFCHLHYIFGTYKFGQTVERFIVCIPLVLPLVSVASLDAVVNYVSFIEKIAEICQEKWFCVHVSPLVFVTPALKEMVTEKTRGQSVPRIASISCAQWIVGWTQFSNTVLLIAAARRITTRPLRIFNVSCRILSTGPRREIGKAWNLTWSSLVKLRQRFTSILFV